MRREGRAMLDRVATVHRPDCAAVSLQAHAAVDDLPPEDSWLAAEAGAALRRPYDALRRLVGQVAGLLVLAQSSGERAVLDLPAVSIAREQWREVSAALADLSVSGQLQSRLRAMRRAAGLIGVCLDSLDRGGSPGTLELSLNRIAGAYQLLQTASNEQIGLNMVDFRQSCCNCGTAIQ